MWYPVLGKTLPLPELLPPQKGEGMETNEVSAEKYVISLSGVHNSNILHHDYRL